MLFKRALSSEISRVYDILHLFFTFVIKVKLLLQQLWRLGLTRMTPFLKRLRLHGSNGRMRFLCCKAMLLLKALPHTLHAAAYIQQCFRSGICRSGLLKVCRYLRNVHVFLVMAKTKVAPIKVPCPAKSFLVLLLPHSSCTI